MPTIRRLAVAGAFAATLVGLTAAPALAHVTVHSADAAQGGFGTITFEVPTEGSSPTVKLTVQVPADPPIALVSVQPMPGWTHKETTTTLATPIKTDDGDEVSQVVSTVEWTAVSPADGIKPGEFGQFSISAGTLPKQATLTFKAIQTYADGTQVAWIEQSVNGAEPEHPAPVLSLQPATAEGAAAPSAPAPAAPAAAADSGNGTATAALVLGVLGLLAGLLGLGVALSSRRGRPAPATASAQRPADRAGVQE